jgi:hypothetical protein
MTRDIVRDDRCAGCREQFVISRLIEMVMGIEESV